MDLISRIILFLKVINPPRKKATTTCNRMLTDPGSTYPNANAGENRQSSIINSKILPDFVKV
jgi:hypothetical protein